MCNTALDIVEKMYTPVTFQVNKENDGSLDKFRSAKAMMKFWGMYSILFNFRLNPKLVFFSLPPFLFPLENKLLYHFLCFTSCLVKRLILF